MKLYKIDGSPPVRAVLMTMRLLGLEFEGVEVNTLNLEQYKPEFIQKNPLHTVPLLEEDGFLLADSHAIITYLTSKYGADKRAVLYPVDLRTRAIVDQRFFFDATIAFPKIRDIVMSIVKNKQPGPSPQQKSDVNEVYAFVEKYLERSAYLAGEHLTLADISVVATVSSLDKLVPVEAKYERLREWWSTLQEKDWYQAANVPGLEMFGGAMKKFIENNQK